MRNKNILQKLNRIILKDDYVKKQQNDGQNDEKCQDLMVMLI